ncbi:hypothetical protein BDR26DRAFT_861193 [Obelidium mucronatum]|nr:hypothetical protein BDR26DRAFT_861193 [Obelidium mucronatum]
MKVWKLVSSPKMSESAKRVLDGLCWDEIIRGRKQQRRSEENANGWDENTDQGEIYDEEEEEEGDSIGLEDSIWLSGVENDTMGIGELVEHVHGEILNSADEQSDVRHNMGSNQTKSWTGAGKYELELVKSIEASYPIECMSIDGNHLVTGGRGPTPLTLWTLSPYPKVIRHLTATKPFLRPPHQHSSSHITCIHVSYPYAVTAQKQLLQIWHLPTATLLAAVSKQTDSNTSCVKLVQNENTGVWWIFEACAYGSISVWKIDNRTTPILSTTPRNNNRNTTTQNQEHQIPSSIKIKPIPDPLRSSLEEAREIECIVYGAEALTFMGSFETMGGINSAQIRETGVENHWELLCGFKDGNIRGWNVGLSCSNSVDTPSQATDPDGYMINQITIKTTGSLCSLGDWITWLNEDPIADVVIAGAWDGRIRVWDKRKKALRRSLVSDIRSAVLCLKTVGEYFLVAGSYNGSLVVYDFSRTK